MSLNIKNEMTHAKVRRLAALTGMSQTAAVDDAVERRLHELETDDWGTRGPAIRALLARAQSIFTPEAIASSRRAEQELYDPKTGLPA
ncbi:type II toxin-antitoxin system VapB family antitoxin [Leucobacter coleopterorum]|uniref:Type II toxin-antitoxin system VapB family antitoxin n=1 Tax=Leucobacter coleopterorum TaxID=2714933 RepID=A0ABX6JX64_9MICO|nr:type II toxin-antitoxin system VapB family antitoxin [Leucobacter coleopterorum]QIM18912.1 type II toxin-antitoxin system VapB family antitoxin [Leucobacter coleopterorum]